MRILAGTLKGRNIIAPKGRTTRPTLSRVRQVLFDILDHGEQLPEWPQIAIVDVFAGSGSIGFEALSRGAFSAHFFDNDPVAQQVIAQNAAQFGLEGAIQIHSDARNPIRTASAYQILFFDPPYDEAQHLAACIKTFHDQGWFHAHSLIVVQMPAKIPAFSVPFRSKTMGITRLDFYMGTEFSNQTDKETPYSLRQ